MPPKGVLRVKIVGDHSELDKSTKGALGSLGTFAKAGAAAVAGAGFALFKFGETFDGMKDAIIVGTGASGKALDGLVASAKKVGATTPASFEDIGNAIADVNRRLGLTGEPLEHLSSQFLNLSRITGTDLKTNVANITRVFGDWSISTENQSKALDTIFRATQLTGVGLDELSTNVVQFGAPLRQMGFSFEQSIAMFAKWEKEGVNTQTVMSGMKIGLGKMAKAGEAPVETFKRVVAQIKAAGSAGEANKIALETFGQRAGPDMAAAIREGRFELDGLVTQLADSKGAISDADQNTRDFAESWQLFTNKVLLKLEPLAVKFFDALSAGMEWIEQNAIPIVETIARFIGDKLGPAIRDTTQFIRDHRTEFGILAAFIGGVLVAYGLYKTTVGLITIATRAWAAAQLLLNTAMRANPIILIATVVAGLVAVFIHLWQTNAEFRDFFINMWNGIKLFFSTTLQSIKSTAQTVWNAIKLVIINPISEAVTAVKDAFNGVVGFFQKLPGWIESALSTLAGIITWPFRKAWEEITGIADRILETIDRITGNLNTGFSGGSGVAGRLTARAAGLGSGGQQRRAHGGPVLAGRPYVVGERGPELFLPGVSGSVLSNADLEALMAAADRDARAMLAGVPSASPSGSAAGGTFRIVLDFDGADADLKRLFRRAVKVEGRGSAERFFKS